MIRLTSKSTFIGSRFGVRYLTSFDPAARLEELGFKLPSPSTPKGAYVMAVKSGNLLFLAGHIPTMPGGKLLTGKVGADKTIEEGRLAAELCGINMLATIKNELGDLRRVKRVVKVLGVVNCADGFGDQPKVINGFSDLFGKVFGERGLHARSAIGTNSLPLNVLTEVEAVVEFE